MDPSSGHRNASAARGSRAASAEASAAGLATASRRRAKRTEGLERSWGSWEDLGKPWEKWGKKGENHQLSSSCLQVLFKSSSSLSSSCLGSCKDCKVHRKNKVWYSVDEDEKIWKTHLTKCAQERNKHHHLSPCKCQPAPAARHLGLIWDLLGLHQDV